MFEVASRGSLAAGLAVVLGALPAAAQSPNWSGYYVGLNAGAAWGDSTTKAVIPDAPNAYFDAANRADVRAAIASNSVDDTAFTGGAQAGWNMQTGGFVLGVEGDINVMRLNGSFGVTRVYPVTAPFTYTYTAAVETDYLATLRARAGMTYGNLLLYVTGGLAMTELKVSQLFTDNFGFGARASGSTSDFKAGWTIGGGAEMALNRNWSIKAEYLYLDFGSVSGQAAMTLSATPTVVRHLFNQEADLTAHVLRAGVNYRF
jgi:outer membrane immunogenic protein